ncbi:dienelactone hydrolase family protein [Sphingomonas sp.]|jgi:carboxymethylenebutenolidase|uniref:dienelactone hydrolase family protein n=1 Tax=Sphingomonas sp. TaxID=28214 RepID=UPI002D7F1E78|nr:dienelactone hydrolase family protein [Sphingomonas sp.]HEU0045260.1 dienelactone hydrolase family protein [Sphingomonas sp.]
MTDERKTAADFPREVLTLFDHYVHGGLSRRGFLDGSARVLGSAAAATAVLGALTPDFAGAQVIAPDDKRITIARVEIPSPAGSGTIRAYVAKPKGASRRARKPVVLVIHENRGLNPHIEDIARRLATHGYIAVAPDALTALGGYPGNEDAARALFGKLDQVKIFADFLASAAWAQALPDGNGKLGATGFCYGGAIVSRLATRVPTLRAGAPFYGSPPPLDGIPAIKAELIVHLAGNDERVNAQWPPAEAAMKAAGTAAKVIIYPGVEHGFNNDTTPRFNKEAADLAWARTLALFRKHLG